MAATGVSVVVDDEPRVTELLPEVLAVYGYETVTADSVVETGEHDHLPGVRRPSYPTSTWDTVPTASPSSTPCAVSTRIA